MASTTEVDAESIRRNWIRYQAYHQRYVEHKSDQDPFYGSLSTEYREKLDKKQTCLVAWNPDQNSEQDVPPALDPFPRKWHNSQWIYMVYYVNGKPTNMPDDVFQALLKTHHLPRPSVAARQIVQSIVNGW